MTLSDVVAFWLSELFWSHRFESRQVWLQSCRFVTVGDLTACPRHASGHRASGLAGPAFSARWPPACTDGICDGRIHLASFL